MPIFKKGFKLNVYINSTGHFLPGKAISNDEIEDILGLIHGKKSRLKNKILNKIIWIDFI